VVNKLSDRDKLGSWIAFRKLLDKGEDPNGILGILFWAVKDGIKAVKGGVASRTGTLMKKNYKKEELLNQGEEIIRLYHESKTGKEDIVLGIEKFILDSSNKSR
jgi:DNA polymerase III delta subunit